MQAECERPGGCSPRLKYWMDYVQEHPDEISKVASVQKKVRIRGVQGSLALIGGIIVLGAGVSSIKRSRHAQVCCKQSLVQRGLPALGSPGSGTMGMLASNLAAVSWLGGPMGLRDMLCTCVHSWPISA